MPDRITMQVTRYRPEEESGESVQEYEVPCSKDWVVLDGLNYIKDRLDGSLSYRWSCRMGVCGSCGMTVNGEPKLTCETFLSEYGSGPVRVEPLKNFPVIRDLVVEIGDFMRKLVDGQAVDHPPNDKACVRRRVPADAGRARRVQAVQHVHQLHAVLFRVSRFTGSSPASLARRPSRSRSATTSIRAMKAAPSGSTCCRSTTASGAARSWASAQRCARSMWIRRAPSSDTS